MNCMNSIQECYVSLRCDDIPQLPLNENHKNDFKYLLEYKTYKAVNCTFSIYKNGGKIEVVSDRFNKYNNFIMNKTDELPQQINIYPANGIYFFYFVHKKKYKIKIA